MYITTLLTIVKIKASPRSPSIDEWRNIYIYILSWVQFLAQEDSLEKGTATHSSILAWRCPWTEKLGGLWSIGQDHIHVSAGINWESPNFTCSWPSPSLQCLSFRLVTHYCLKMIMIKFHLNMQKIEIGPFPYTT